MTFLPRGRSVRLAGWAIMPRWPRCHASIADLFGLSFKAGRRYTATMDHPDLTTLT
jgi:hypothetical protein